MTQLGRPCSYTSQLDWHSPKNTRSGKQMLWWRYDIRAIVKPYAESQSLWLFLDDKCIDAIDRILHSPDRNPIKNKDVMYQCIQGHRVVPQTAQQITDALIQVWEKIPQNTNQSYLKHAQTLSGLHIGTWEPYTLPSYIMSYRDKIHASWISLRFQSFNLIFNVILNDVLIICATLKKMLS